MQCCLSAYQPCEIHNQHGSLGHVRRNEGQFMVERSQPESTESFAETHDTRVWEGVFATDFEDPRCIVAFLTRWFGTCQHHQDQERSPLGQLGRLLANGEATPSVRG